MSCITDSLDEKCRRIVRKMKKHPSEPTPVTFIEREMALTLDHMDTIRERQKALSAWSIEKELYIDTQILNLEQRADRLPDWLERTRFKNKLNQMLYKVEWDVRRLAIEEESALQQLRKRLLELWNMHDQL